MLDEYKLTSCKAPLCDVLKELSHFGFGVDLHNDSVYDKLFCF